MSLVCFFLISILHSIFIGAPHRFLQVLGEFIFAAYCFIIEFLLCWHFSPSEWYQSSLVKGLFFYLLERWRHIWRWYPWVEQTINFGRTRWRTCYLWRICIFWSLTHRSQILCLMKSGVLNMNVYVVLLDTL